MLDINIAITPFPACYPDPTPGQPGKYVYRWCNVVGINSTDDGYKFLCIVKKDGAQWVEEFDTVYDDDNPARH